MEGEPREGHVPWTSIPSDVREEDGSV
jgi:hypothetical protein